MSRISNARIPDYALVANDKASLLRDGAEQNEQCISWEPDEMKSKLEERSILSANSCLTFAGKYTPSYDTATPDTIRFSFGRCVYFSITDES